MEWFVALRLLGNALLFLLPAEESYVDFMSINQKVCWGSHFVMLILTRLGTWRLCAKRARYSLRKQPKSSCTAKWPLRNERRNSLLMTRHYPDLGDAFDWLKQIFHVARPIRSTAYNGGQKCWDLSSDITKTSDLSPLTPNKVEFGAKWVKMSALFGHIIARGSGRTTV